MSRADYSTSKGTTGLAKSEIQRVISELEKQMKDAAKNLEFEKAAVLRDQVFERAQHPGRRIKALPLG